MHWRTRPCIECFKNTIHEFKIPGETGSLVWLKRADLPTYHKESCGRLKDSPDKTSLSLEHALKNRDLHACGLCHPPNLVVPPNPSAVKMVKLPTPVKTPVAPVSIQPDQASPRRLPGDGITLFASPAAGGAVTGAAVAAAGGVPAAPTRPLILEPVATDVALIADLAAVHLSADQLAASGSVASATGGDGLQNSSAGVLSPPPTPGPDKPDHPGIPDLSEEYELAIATASGGVGTATGIAPQHAHAPASAPAPAPVPTSIPLAGSAAVIDKASSAAFKAVPVRDDDGHIYHSHVHHMGFWMIVCCIIMM